MILITASVVLFTSIAYAAGWNNYLQRFIQQVYKPRKTGDSLFDNYFIEPKAYYLKLYKQLPNIAYISNIDGYRIYEKIKNGDYGLVKRMYQRNYYNWQQERIEFDKTLFVLSNKMMIRLTEDWLDILFDGTDHDKANNMLQEFKAMRQPEKEADYEINIISLSNNSLDLKTLSIKPVELDLDLYYNDDFKAIDTIIKERLGKENDKGIVLLHGLPGTGKTTYLRHLIGSITKRVLFVSPSVAGNLMNPEFMDLLIDNPNAVLVIEDAENIIMDRRYSSHSSVSNLLNISDGLLSDCLNVQIICTFNSDVALIDQALMRKGRLIARYEFGKLEVAKAQALSKHLGYERTIQQPMTLAELTNPDEHQQELKTVNVIGFRRHEPVLNN